MFIKKNDGTLIRKEAICYIRHIKNLSDGYDKITYPEYSVFLNGMQEAIENLDQVNLSLYEKVDDIPPEYAIFYPGKSEITYYINFKKVSVVKRGTDCVDFYFSEVKKLRIFNKNVLTNIILK